MTVVHLVLSILFRIQIHVAKAVHWAGIRSRLRWEYWRSRLASLGENTSIFANVVIHNPQMVSIGNGCSIAEFVHIWGGGQVTIGDNVLVASHVAITSMTHDPKAEIFSQTSVKQPVVIEDNVWIGAGAVILPGTRLESGCIVGAGAVVTKDVPADWIVTGVPAQRLRRRKEQPL